MKALKTITSTALFLSFILTGFSSSFAQAVNQGGGNDVEIAIVETESITYIGLKAEVDATNPAIIAETMGNLYGELTKYVETSGTETTGAPIAVYKSFGQYEIEVICGLPVNKGYIIHHESIKVGETLGGKAVKTTHRGNYDKLPFTHEKVNNFIEENNLRVVGYPYEIYITDPDKIPDPTQWITEIYYPLGK